MRVDGSRWLVLDAMGVLYEVGDDLREILIPYLHARGTTLSDAEIEDVYRDTGLGKLSSGELWRACGVEVADEDYVTNYRLMPGIRAVIEAAVASGYRLACLSNDVAEWSRLHRERFNLTTHIERWYISGDLGVRKPDPEAYVAVLDDLGIDGRQCIFVDDRARNVDAAAMAGMRAVHLGSRDHPTVESLVDVL